jgi:polyisoprenoid-binding protein YceI
MMKRIFAGILAITLLGSFTPPTPIPYTIDPATSTVQWTGYYLFSFGEHYGNIDIKSGQVQLTDGSVTQGKVVFDMNTITARDMPADDGGTDLSNHLKSRDFFDAAKFPDAQFEIVQVKKVSDASPSGPNVEVTGTLVIKGIRNSITFPATLNTDDHQLVLQAKFKFDRTKWDIRYNSGKYFSEIGDGAISDAIGIELNIVANKTTSK